MTDPRDQTLAVSIQKLYEVFASYSTISGHFGKCGWLTEQQVLTLKTVPLQQLIAEQLQEYADHTSSCGTQDELKHFLPRLLELFSQGETLSLDTALFFLNIACDYSPAEWSAIDAVLTQLWKKLITTCPFDFSPDDLLCGFAQIYPDLSKFLALWDSVESLESLRQIALFASEATYSIGWEHSQRQMQQVVDWLLSTATIQKLRDGAAKYAGTPYETELVEATVTLLEWKDSFGFQYPFRERCCLAPHTMYTWGMLGRAQIIFCQRNSADYSLATRYVFSFGG